MVQIEIVSIFCHGFLYSLNLFHSINIRSLFKFSAHAAGSLVHTKASKRLNASWKIGIHDTVFLSPF